MRTITINTRKSEAVYEWGSKEEGSFEDHNRDASHAYAILQRFGGKVTLTEDEAKTLIESGRYQSTSWKEDEILGGQKTMDRIAKYVKDIDQKLKQLNITPCLQ